MSAETLRRAAAIVRERGWTQGAYEDDNGRVCAEGALVIAHGGRGAPSRLAGASQLPPENSDPRLGKALLPLATFAGYCDDAFWLRDVIGRAMVAIWNDAPERTADEVVAALEAAADRLEATS